nr:hypothetical protein [Tanacetum cinerariifolium]
MEWRDYKHLDWISVRRDDDQIYKFKEGDFKWLRLQDIEDMLLLLEHCHQEARRRPSTGSGKLPEEAQPDEARHEHCHQEARGRPSTRSGKLPEEAQPDEARHVPNRSEVT